MRSWLLGFTLLLLMGGGAWADPLYKNPKAPLEARVKDLLAAMTLEEKIELLHGNDLETHANARLGIPALKMTDGPLGVRWEKSTAFPAGIDWAAAFDPPLVARIAAALSVETRAHGRDMLLAPCVNISRCPQGGRNFESFGEDPYLAAVYAASYVASMKQRGVLSCTKHFAANEQETDRMTIDVRVDERTLNEIHLPAFRAALRAGTPTIMASYNKLNGAHASENEVLLDQWLKGEWKFKGPVVSDWGATHSTVNAANHGLDLEMPFGDNWGHGLLLAAVKEGKVSEAAIDDKVSRLLRVMFEYGLFDRRPTVPASALNNAAHKALALQAAQEGMVLLSNRNGLLPIAPGRAGKPRSIAIIGPNSMRARAGGGSSMVVPFHGVSPVEGFHNRCQGKLFTLGEAVGLQPPDDIIGIPSAQLRPSADAPAGVYGLKGEYFANDKLEGTPVLTRVDKEIDFSWSNGSPDPKLPVDHFSVRWSGVFTPTSSGPCHIAVRADDGSRLYIDNKLVIDDWHSHAAETHRAVLDMKAGHPYAIRLEYYEETGDASVSLGRVKPEGDELARAITLARKSDVAIVCVGWASDLEGEGVDRTSLSLPYGQDRLIEAVAKVNPHTIVVINSGGSVLMPWLDRVQAVVQAWYPGEQGGNALADLLLGNVNFSAKLPVSFYRRAEDASSYGSWPGHKGTLTYSEGIFVGYRHLDRARIAPLFPFGFGMSYTRFDLRNAKLSAARAQASAPRIEVSVDVTNRGPRAGAEVVQLYVHEAKPVVSRPLQELKGFRRVTLQPGVTQRVTFPLDSTAFAWYDVKTHGWKVTPGAFSIRLGTSSRDIRAELPVVLR